MKPILFNTDMVKAILDGRKSCTRRIVKHDVEAILNSPYHKEHPEVEDEQIISKLCIPPYQPGDILYVRETWQYLYELDGNEQVVEDTGKYYYAATDTILFDTYVDENGVKHDYAPWRPSIHMPKEAARIWLKVTNVKVERLQEITIDGIRNEGLSSMAVHAGDMKIALKEWGLLWNSTIKKSVLDSYGWNANPWVWVIEFERCDKPESKVL